MKVTDIFLGTAIVLLIAGSSTLTAQGVTEVNAVDTNKLKDMQLHMNHPQDIYQNPDSTMMKGNRPAHMMGMEHPMGPGNMMQGMQKCMCPRMRMMTDMRPELGIQGMNGRMSHQPARSNPHQECQQAMGMRPQHQGTGARVLQNIPDLTDRQMKELEKLRQRQQEDIRKLKEENQKRMSSMREKQREALMNILTPEQKKWMDENLRPEK